MFCWNFVIYPAVGRTIRFSPRIRLGGAVCQHPALSTSNDLCGGTKNQHVRIIRKWRSYFLFECGL